MKTGLACTLLFAGSLCLSGAHAASFDCGKARTAVEKAICRDPALGRLDEAIGQAYRSLLEKVEPRFGAKVQDAQRNWLRSRSSVEGLQETLQKRLDNLKNALVTTNGVAMLRVDGDHLPPYVLTPLPGAAAYNREVDGILEVSRSDSLSDADMAECDRLSNAQGTTSPSAKVARKLEECELMASTSRRYRVDFVSPDLLSIEEDVSEYVWHAAHPSNSDGHLNRWLSKVGKVGPDDIFASPAYRRVLAAGVRRYLKKQGVEREGAPGADVDLEPDHWGFTATALRITGQGYDYDMGRGYVEIEIPWRDFGSAAKPQFVNALKKGKQ